MEGRRKVFLLFLWIFGVILTLSVNVKKGRCEQKLVGFIEKFQGVVKVKRVNSFRSTLVKGNNTKLFVGDIVRTKRHSWSLIRFLNGHKLLLEEKSILYIEKASALDLKNGRVYVRIRKGVKGLKLKAGIALIGVKGTKFAVNVSKNGMLIYVKEGKIEITSLKGMFKRYVKKQKEEFEAYMKKELEEFKKYKKRIEKEFYEYIKSFELKEGNGVIIVDNEVYKTKVSPEFLKGFKMLD